MMRYLGLTFCNLMGAKLNSVHDYLPLPWDDKLSGNELTEEEVDQLLELMRKENEAIEKDKKQKKLKAAIAVFAADENINNNSVF